jgi:NADH-quinone oxidoreductase subunit C
VVEVLTALHGKGYSFLASLHGVDYYPEEPRLGILYELLDMHAVDRISVKARVGIDDPKIATVTGLFPGANHPEREVYDMFGVIFEGHPDLRRILMPEDYEGFPQRRDFPIGGEPVLFTYNEENSYGKWQ